MAGKAARTEAPRADVLDLVIERIFDAPRNLVWKAWTDPEMLARWSAPRDLSIPEAHSDVRVGGHYRVTMQAPDGRHHRLRGEYRELTPPLRIVMTHQWINEDGSLDPETVCTVTFEARGQKTYMHFHQVGFGSAPSRDGHRGGWMSAFGVLDDLLAAQK
jgi:uncharacterized protein YndB with AHSA1/START domain